MKNLWSWLLVENNRKALSFLGTGIAVVVVAGWTYFTYFDKSPKKVVEAEPARSVIDEVPGPEVASQPREVKLPKAKPLQPFSGVYVGISTEGFNRQPIKINFTHRAGRSTGTYTLSGLQGEMDGIVTGNKYQYTWRLGAYNGRGISYIRGNAIEGTWGYGESVSNAGTLTAQLQQ